MEASNSKGVRGVLGQKLDHALLKWMREQLFLSVHVAYFVAWALVGALELWISPKPRHSPPLSFIDALFNAVSAVTETGLGSVAMHRFSLLDQLTLLLLMIVGSQVFTSIIPLFLRRVYSTTREPHSSLLYPHAMLNEEEVICPTNGVLLHEEKLSQQAKKSLHSIEQCAHFKLGILGASTCTKDTYHDCSRGEGPKLGMESIDKHESMHGRGDTHTKVTSSPSIMLKTKENYSGRDHTHTSVTSSPSTKFETQEDYNGRGHIHTSLTLSSSKVLEPEEDYIHKKAMEAKALTTMCWVTIFYFVVSLMVGFLIFQICIVCSSHASGVLKKNRMNSSLFSIFSVVSAFANNGFILLDENMEPMQREGAMVVWLSMLILMGNTLYAPTMRGVIWVLYKGAKGEREQVFGYILKTTRRNYTHLFPRKETIWLVGTVVFINAFQMICILGLEWRSQALKELSPGYKLVATLLQSITTRSAGMNVVSLSGFSSSILFVFLGAMYIATYPIYVAKQHTTKVFHGVTIESKSDLFFQQLRKLRSQDLFLFLAIFLICTFERDSINNDPINFSFFNIIFEVISGYGNVGLSIGYNCKLRMVMTAATSACKDIPCSLSGKWSMSSKMIMILVMLFGRHRGLPQDIDWKISTSLTKTCLHHYNS